jgi:hypothetical protein
MITKASKIGNPTVLPVSLAIIPKTIVIPKGRI